MKKYVFMILGLIAFTCQTNAQSVVATREFNNALKAYFEAKNALAKDELAQDGATKLGVVIREFPVKTLSAEQQQEWPKIAAELTKYSKQIIDEKDLKAQRKSFENVSSAMIKLARTLGLNQQDIYVQHCPMVKRSWLNEVKEIQNPFYGSKMYDCGEVTEILSKK